MFTRLWKDTEFYGVGCLKFYNTIYNLEHKLVLDLRSRLNTLVGFGDEIFKSSSCTISINVVISFNQLSAHFEQP